MATKSKLAIRAAVMNCIARCLESDAPYTCLGEFLEKLAVMGWGPDDVRAVAMAVMPLIGTVKCADAHDTAGVKLSAV